MTATTAPTDWIRQLTSAPLSERGAVLETLVVAELRTWLLMEPTERLPLDESYFELGLTSLGATELQERLEHALGRRIDSATLFNNPTIGHLLAHLRDEVLVDLFTPAAPSPLAHAAVTSGAPRSSPKDLLNNLLDELYDS